MSERGRLLVALLVCALPSLCSAQPQAEIGMPVLRNYTSKEYSNDPQVWSILQDRRGVLFFGTSSSILEYDGVTWRTIHAPSTVRSLVMDAAGRIWVGSVADFGYLDPDAHGTLQYVSLVEKIPPEQRSFGDVWQVLITPQGNFFRSYPRLFRWDGKRMRGWEATTEFEALSEVRGRIYTSQIGIGLQEIVGDELSVAPGGDAYKNSKKLFLYPYDERRILVSARNEALTLYDGSQVTPFPTQADDYLRKGELYNSAPLPDGGFCLTTLHGGAIVLDHDGRLRRIINKDSGLQHPMVYAAFADREGALWLGLGSGITRVDVNSPISLFFRDIVYDVVRYNGFLYGSTPIGVACLFRLAPNRGTGLSSLQPIPAPPPEAYELLVFRDPAGKAPPQLLAATAFGVMKIDGDTLSRALPRGPGLVDGARSLMQSRKSPNRVFVGGAASLSSMRWSDGGWVDEGRHPAGPNTDSLAEEPDGTLWAGTETGVLRVANSAAGMRDARVERLTQKDGLAAGANAVISAGGEIFAVPYEVNRMLRWDGSARRFVVDSRFLLPLKDPDARAALFPLPNGDIWSLNSSYTDQRQGIFHRQADGTWQLDEETFRGLSQFGEAHVRLDPDGSLWIAGGDGLVRYDPRVKPSARLAISALVRRVSAGAENLIFGGATAAGASALRLPYAHNSLQFEFAAPTYGSEDKTTYQYLLEGAGKEWSAWSKQKGANYSGLGPGSYRFRVRARTIDGRTGDEGVFRFTILPPWYRSWWAYALYVALLLAGLYKADRFQRRRLLLRERARSRLRETELRAETAAAQAQALQAENDRKRNVELLSDIGKEITGSLDLDTILFKLYARVNQIVDAGVFGVGLYRPEKQIVEFSLAIENGKRDAPYTRDTRDKNQFAVWCIDHRKPVLIGDAATEYGKYFSSYRNGGRLLEDGSTAQAPASMMYLPLVAQDRVLGVLGIQSFRKNAYTEQHLSLLESLAAYTTIALDNARLFEEARQARAAAEQADEAKSSFLSTVSHELRTPLTSVLGFAKIIRRRLDEIVFPLVPEDDKKVLRAKRQVAENLNVVISEGERLTTLINDVLDLAKIQAGKISWNMATLSISVVIERAIAATSSLFEAKKLNLVRDIQPDLPDITGDRDRLIQVVINLISNAVKFTEAGSVTLAASLGKGELVVSVTDSGIGIKPEDQPKVFEKFKQVGDTLTDKPQGTGLGLPISKEIVEHHRGRMWVESEIGKGSTFFFTLPVQPVEVAGPFPAGPGSVAQRG